MKMVKILMTAVLVTATGFADVVTNSIDVANSSFESPEYTVTTGGSIESWGRYGINASGLSRGYIVNDDSTAPDTTNGTQYGFICDRKGAATDPANPNWICQKVMGGAGQYALKEGDELTLTVSLVTALGTTENIGFGFYTGDLTTSLDDVLAVNDSLTLTSEFQDFTLTWTAEAEDAGKDVYIVFWSLDYGTTVGSPRIGVDNVRLISVATNSITIKNSSFESPVQTATVGGSIEDWARYGINASGLSRGYIPNSDAGAPDTIYGNQYGFICNRKGVATDPTNPNWIIQQVMGGDGQETLGAGETLELTVSLVNALGTTTNIGFGFYTGDLTTSLDDVLAVNDSFTLTSEFQDFTLTWTAEAEDAGKDVYIVFWSADYGMTVASPRMGIDNVRLVTTDAPPTLFIISATDSVTVTASNLTTSLTSTLKSVPDLTSTNWLPVGDPVSGVTETNWVVNTVSNALFFKVESE